jgi:hypothetical protein
MRRPFILASILGVTALGLVLAGPSRADNLSIGVQTGNVNLGINIGPTPPPLVVVPGPVVTGPPPPPVYTAPDLPYNYFVYKQVHYLYHDGRWFRGRRHDGPWTVIAIANVPRPILAVPVEHYRVRPTHWTHHGPPPWKHERDRERRREHERGGGHDRDDDRRGHGRGHK